MFVCASNSVLALQSPAVLSFCQLIVNLPDRQTEAGNLVVMRLLNLPLLFPFEVRSQFFSFIFPHSPPF